MPGFRPIAVLLVSLATGPAFAAGGGGGAGGAGAQNHPATGRPHGEAGLPGSSNNRQPQTMPEEPKDKAAPESK